MGKTFYRACKLDGGADAIPAGPWLRYNDENEPRKHTVLTRFAGHNQLIKHRHA